MPDFITVAATEESVGIVQCRDCSAAWKQTDEFVAACPKCSSAALDEYQAVVNPADPSSYIAIALPDEHLS